MHVIDVTVKNISMYVILCYFVIIQSFYSKTKVSSFTLLGFCDHLVHLNHLKACIHLHLQLMNHTMSPHPIFSYILKCVRLVFTSQYRRKGLFDCNCNVHKNQYKSCKRSLIFFKNVKSYDLQIAKTNKFQHFCMQNKTQSYDIRHLTVRLQQQI